MGALTDAAVARRLPELSLQCCTPPAAAPLARLLTEGSLTAFAVFPSEDDFVPMFDAAGAALVADALRVSTTLKTLNLCYARWCLDMRAAGTLLMSAIVGHPSLCELYIQGEFTTSAEDCRAFGAALAALVAADAPALQVLNCSYISLCDAGVTLILEALPLNYHLRKLDVGDKNVSEAFARSRQLPVEAGPAAADAEGPAGIQGHHA